MLLALSFNATNPMLALLCSWSICESSIKLQSLFTSCKVVKASPAHVNQLDLDHQRLRRGQTLHVLLQIFLELEERIRLADFPAAQLVVKIPAHLVSPTTISMFWIWCWALALLSSRLNTSPSTLSRDSVIQSCENHVILKFCSLAGLCYTSESSWYPPAEPQTRTVRNCSVDWTDHARFSKNRRWDTRRSCARPARLKRKTALANPPGRECTWRRWSSWTLGSTRARLWPKSRF